MKKIFLMILFTLSFTPFALADVIKSGTYENVTWTLSSDSVLTFSGDGNATALFTGTFNTDRNKIKKVVLNNTITGIDGCAFQYFERLETIQMSNSVKSIGKKAFDNCHILKSITIPSSVTSIGGDAFQACSNLSVVNIYDLKSWCNIDFENNYSNPMYFAKILEINGKEITDLVIPESITYIKKYAFYGCSNITSITIPNTVTGIGEYAFSHLGLITLNIPESITNIGKYTFSDCKNLTTITIPESVTSIEEGAFSGCTKLTSINIPKYVEEIGNMAFGDCSSLTSFYVPWPRPLSISEKVFYNVSKTKCTLYVPQGTSSLYADATGWSQFIYIKEYSNDNKNVYMTIQQNNKEVAKQKVISGNTIELTIPDGYVSVTFNDEDVTSQIANGIYTTPSITKNSTINIMYNKETEDINGDGDVDSQDVLLIYKYMKNH